MMVKKHTPEAQTPAIKLVIIGRKRRSMVLKGMLILAGTALLMPSCKSHKLCEAYSSIESKKVIKSGPVFSIYQSQSGHTVQM
ncbi:MAG: hypothetical protein ACHQRM_07150 [Bacteroidia bacterium]